MTIRETIAAFRFKGLVHGFDQFVFDLYLMPTTAADKMMMLVPRNFIGKMTRARQCRARQPIFREEFQRTVNRGFRQAGKLMASLLIDLDWRKMPTCVVKYVQNRQPLRCHSVAAGAELRGILISTRHDSPYCNLLQ